ncbi:MAG: hypothetical protein N3D75_03850 [Candidatus Aenigmarchaeota archaeon]|nr:hypothetical protein [Candidatus Aenigmarchaeota archaeon]
MQFKKEQELRCEKVSCNGQMPYIGALEDYNDLQLAVSKILGKSIIKHYYLSIKKDLNSNVDIKITTASSTTTTTVTTVTTTQTTTTRTLITTTHATTTTYQKINSKVLLIIYNPIIESQNSEKLTNVMKWNDPIHLTDLFIQRIKESSHDIVHYDIVETIEIDEIPVKLDGFKYTDEEYINCATNNANCHFPDGVDYMSMTSSADFSPQFPTDLVKTSNCNCCSRTYFLATSIVIRPIVSLKFPFDQKLPLGYLNLKFCISLNNS